MNARDVIADCLKQLRRPGARTTDAGDAAFVTAALAAAGYVVVPRKLTEEMVVSILHDTGVERAPAAWFWRSALAAAEAEAKEGG